MSSNDRGRHRPIDAAALRLDGKPLALVAPAWSVKDSAIGTNDPAAVEVLIAAIGDGHAITPDAAPSKDDDTRTVPLDGFTAALLLIDAVQGRLGRPTALVAVKCDAAPPFAPPLPLAPRWTKPFPLTRPEADRLRKEVDLLRPPVFDKCDVREPSSAYALGASSALAIHPCCMAAHQGSSVVAVLPRAGGAAKPVILALHDVPGRDGKDVATDGPDMIDPSFDPATGTLSTVSQDRDRADCGTSASWVWSGWCVPPQGAELPGPVGRYGAGRLAHPFRTK